MKKMFNFRNLAILCLAFGLVVSLTRCKKYDDDVNSLQTQISALKADVKKDFKEKVDVDIANLKTQLDANVAKLKELESSSASSADVDAKIAAVKQDLVNTLVSIETFNTFKEMVEGQIEDAATKEDLGKVNTKINSLEGRVAALEAAGKTASGESQALKDFKAKYATEYQGLKDDIADLSAKIAANSSAIQGLRDLIKSKVDQSTLDALKDKLNKSLGNKADQSKLDKLNTDLRALITALQTGKADKSTVEALQTKLDNFLNKDLGVTIAALTGRLTGLILVPDYVADKGGALPVLNFSPIRTKKCGDLVPAVMVKYMVNPSNATEDQIDKANLKFYYNDPMVAAKSNNTVDQKAEFVSLQDGVLTVKATLNTAKLWASKTSNPENRIDQLMLQVPLKDGNVINSDWVKVTFKPEAPAIVKIPKRQAADAWKLYELKPFVNASEAPSADESVKEGVVIGNNTKDYTVVEMVYDEDLDLMKHVQAMYRYLGNTNLEAALDLTAYGLHFDFDLNNAVTNKPIVYKKGSNKTDQQKFINLKGTNNSIVTTKVYTKDGNRAAIDRTPIVHVMLKTESGCVAKDGYIKLNIIDKVIPPVIYKSKKDLVAECGTQEANRIGTQRMNEDFYHVVNMTKAEFHKNYKFAQVPNKPSDPTNVGTITQLPDNGTDESYNLVYTLTEDEVWNNIGKTVWAEATYTFGSSVIKVKFETKITKETVKLNLVLGNFWYDGDTQHKALTTGKYNAIVSNVAIPAAGATNPTLCTWDNNVNDVFKTGSDKLLDLNAQGYPGYTYRYEFDTTQKRVSGVRFVVESSDAANGKVNDLLYGVKGGTKELVAKIKPAVANVGNNIEYQQTDLAKWLVNEGPETMRAKVVLVVLNTPCKKPVNVVITNVQEKDRFDVIFVRPVNVKDGSSTPFYDVVGAGNPGSYIDMKDVAVLSDWRNYVTHTKEFTFSKYPNFYDYYDVVNIKADIANIKTRNLAGASPNMPSTLNIAQTANGEVFNGNTYRYGRLTYDNNGHNFNTDFTLIVPITISYKWGDVKTKIEIEVNSTDTPNP